MKVLILKQVEIEGPGIIGNCLTGGQIPHQILNLEQDPLFPKLDDFTHIVLLGGPMNVYEEDRYPFLRGEDLFIKEALQRGKKILGICLGAQLIAKALGATVRKSAVREIGWYHIQLTEEGKTDPLFSHMPESFAAFQWHEDTFDIPKSARLMATSYPVFHQAFRYGEGAYGLQFHLEVTPEMIHDWMKEYKETTEVPFSREDILKNTAPKWTDYSNHGRRFVSRFLGLD